MAQSLFEPLGTFLLDAAREFVKRSDATEVELHALLLKAGAMLMSRALSLEGLEMALAPSHFGPFLLSK